MKQVFEPWHYALRGLILQAPEGPKSPSVTLDLPEDLRPPADVPEEENGFAMLEKHLKEWPLERHPPTDLYHRLQRLPDEKFAADAAIQRLRPMLDGLDPILEMPVWFATIAPNAAVPNYYRIKRLGLALLIRAEIDGDPKDRERVINLARHLRRSQGGIPGFVKGLQLESGAKGVPENLQEDRVEAVRSELARHLIPRLPLMGPWDTPPWFLPSDWADEQRALRWLLSGHPKPYDVEATVKDIVALRPLLDTGSPEQLRAAAVGIAGTWPIEMRPMVGRQSQVIPLPVLYKARPAIRALENAHGVLLVARWLNYVASAAEWVEYAEKVAKPR